MTAETTAETAEDAPAVTVEVHTDPNDDDTTGEVVEAAEAAEEAAESAEDAVRESAAVDHVVDVMEAATLATIAANVEDIRRRLDSIQESADDAAEAAEATVMLAVTEDTDGDSIPDVIDPEPLAPDAEVVEDEEPTPRGLRKIFGGFRNSFGGE